MQKGKLEFTGFHLLPSSELLRKSPETPLSAKRVAAESTNLGTETQLSPSAPSDGEIVPQGTCSGEQDANGH